MRRIVAPLAAAALAAAVLAGPVSAAPAQRVTDTQSGIVCEALTSEAGTVFAAAVTSDLYGPMGYLAFWMAPASPETEPEPTWFAESSVVTSDGLSVTAGYTLVEAAPPNDPVGQATLQATLSPIGDPEPYSFRDQSGNHQFRVDGVVQEYSVSGTLELPGEITFDLSSCSGFVDSYTIFSNAPAATVSRFESFQLNCFWELGPDEFAWLFAISEEFGTFVDMGIGDLSGQTDAVVLTEEEFAASVDLYDWSGLEPVGPVGAASASATLSGPVERINDRFSFDGYTSHLTGWRYAVEGSVTFETPDGPVVLTMDDVSCMAGDLRQADVQRPQPRGRPVPNDTPDAAEPISVGETVTVRSTAGTALDPEAACIADFDGELVEVPIGHTAWWWFEGTGGPVTVDTAGSSFDTVVGVYMDDGGGGLEQVGCVDDVDSLQARITVDTASGTTYYVQVGGLFGATGSLVLSIQ